MKYKIALNGKNYEIEVEKGEAIVLSESELAAFTQVAAPAAAVTAAPAAPAAAAAPTAAVTGDGEVVPAPLPGTIFAVKVSAGQALKKGDLVMVIEAMKMENEVFAPRDGTVTQVIAALGATVSTGDPLFTLR